MKSIFTILILVRVDWVKNFLTIKNGWVNQKKQFSVSSVPPRSLIQLFNNYSGNFLKPWCGGGIYASGAFPSNPSNLLPPYHAKARHPRKLLNRKVKSDPTLSDPKNIKLDSHEIPGSG